LEKVPKPQDYQPGGKRNWMQLHIGLESCLEQTRNVMAYAHITLRSTKAEV
jgi:hypothetical protein